MKFVCDAYVTSVKVREIKGKVYYDLNLDQNGEVMTLNCSPEVAKSVERFREYLLDLEYRAYMFDGKMQTRFAVSAATLKK